MSELDQTTVAADPTAARVALWRALHVQLDARPHVIDDEEGLRLLNPDEAGKAARTCTRRARPLFELPSWGVRASSRIWWLKRRAVACSKCSWARGSIRSRSAGPSSWFRCR